MAVQKENGRTIAYGDARASGGLSVFSKKFDEAFFYDGDDLGVSLRGRETGFRLWAPTAWEAQVVLYPGGEGAADRYLPMKRGLRGLWELTVPENLAGWYYTYRVRIGGQWNEAPDPYAKAVGINGDRGAVIDLAKTNPEGWTAQKPPLLSPTDAVIYELHIRDLSVHPESGIVHKGQYLGLAESGTRGPGGIPTGLDHIADLGVTHVQLLPVADYSRASVDEEHPDPSIYNWGYDPKNFNAPEGSYATDPYDPAVRIRELKTMIQALHDRGLRVILDVVYNHVYDGYRAALARLVPGYYLRHKADLSLSDGSCCGNDIASERPMTRKFIVDSVVFWAREYGVDGFRFDLMGLLDVTTMREIRSRLDEIDPTILTFGEGWILETELPMNHCANQEQVERLPGIGHFNDYLRDAVKGDVLEPEVPGFIQGAPGMEDEVRKGAAGSIRFSDELCSYALEPVQTVNYVECHDNHTLWDKLALTAPEETDEARARMHRLASAIVLTSQGIPFLHAGQEFMRTKGGLENSYNAPEDINRLDWSRCAERQADVLYMKSLIQLRRSHPAFRLRDAETIRRHLVFEQVPERCVGFTLRHHAGGDTSQHLYVLYKANPQRLTVRLPDLGVWSILLGAEQVVRLDGGELEVSGIGAVVLEVAGEQPADRGSSV